MLSADGLVGVVLGRGIAEYFACIDESETSVTYETKRIGSPHPQRCTWTIQDANRAGLGGDNWKKYPRAMLKARCKAALARDVYPDVLAGCYEEDEGREIAQRATSAPPARVEPEPVDAEVVEEYDLDGALVAIRECETPDDLNHLARDFASAPNAVKQRLRKEYADRMRVLNATPVPSTTEAA